MPYSTIFKPKQREIDDIQLERLFAQGKTLAEVAKALNVNYSWLSRKINESLTLSNARKGGIAKAQEKN